MFIELAVLFSYRSVKRAQTWVNVDHNPMTIETERSSHHQVQLILVLNYMRCAWCNIIHFKLLNTVECCSDKNWSRLYHLHRRWWHLKKGLILCLKVLLISNLMIWKWSWSRNWEEVTSLADMLDGWLTRLLRRMRSSLPHPIPISLFVSQAAVSLSLH